MAASPPLRRRSDKSWWARLVRENWYRDIWLLLVSALVLYAVIVTRNNVSDIQSGRKLTFQVFCASTSAVIDAGRATIGGSSTSISPELRRNLEKLGFPPAKEQKRQAKRAADLYAKSISTAVLKQTGVKGLVRKDGTLDCSKIAKISIRG